MTIALRPLLRAAWISCSGLLTPSPEKNEWQWRSIFTDMNCRLSRKCNAPTKIPFPGVGQSSETCQRNRLGEQNCPAGPTVPLKFLDATGRDCAKQNLDGRVTNRT